MWQETSHTVKLLTCLLEVDLHQPSDSKNMGLQTFIAFLLFPVTHRNIIQNISHHFGRWCLKSLGRVCSSSKSGCLLPVGPGPAVGLGADSKVELIFQASFSSPSAPYQTPHSPAGSHPCIIDALDFRGLISASFNGGGAGRFFSCFSLELAHVHFHRLHSVSSQRIASLKIHFKGTVVFH